jgi:hypothetical protein
MRSEKPAQTDRRPQFPGACVLSARDLKRLTEACLRGLVIRRRACQQKLALEFAVPDPLACECHASERFIDEAQPPHQRSHISARLGKDQLVQRRNRHGCSRRVRGHDTLANLGNARSAGSRFRESPPMEDRARRSPSRQVLVLRKVNETPRVAFSRRRIPPSFDDLIRPR